MNIVSLHEALAVEVPRLGSLFLLGPSLTHTGHIRKTFDSLGRGHWVVLLSLSP